MLKNEDICIQLRDIHGNRSIRRFDTVSRAYEWAARQMQENNIEDEILVVTQGPFVLYSALQAEFALEFEDLTGFFG